MKLNLPSLLIGGSSNIDGGGAMAAPEYRKVKISHIMRKPVFVYAKTSCAVCTVTAQLISTFVFTS